MNDRRLTLPEREALAAMERISTILEVHESQLAFSGSELLPLLSEVLGTVNGAVDRFRR
jgi:hypothetical protein